MDCPQYVVTSGIFSLVHLLWPKEHRPSFLQALSATRILGPCWLGLGQGWGRGGQDWSPWGARSAGPVLMLSGRE